MRDIKIYLAGAMDYYRADDYRKATNWRISLTSEINELNETQGTRFSIFDPTLSESTEHNIVNQNLHYLNNSDIIIVNIKDIEHSLGTLGEYFYYAFNNKPIIIYGDHKWTNHPYMKQFISFQSGDITEIVEFLGDAYGQ